jgi:hypothetical protein
MHNTLRQRLSLARTSITHMYAKVRRAFTWQAVGNNSRSMIGGFARTLRFIEGRMSRSTILCLVSFLRHCSYSPQPGRLGTVTGALVMPFLVMILPSWTEHCSERVGESPSGPGVTRYFVSLLREGVPSPRDAYKIV